MEEPDLFGLTAVKQEVEDASSNDDKDVFASIHPILSIKHEANFFAIVSGISADCKPNTEHLEQELNSGGDKGSFDNDVSKQECGTSSMPGLTNICPKQETNADCFVNKLPGNIYVLTENDMIKQEASCSAEKSIKCDICEKLFLQKSRLYKHLRTHSGEKPFKCDMCEKHFTSESRFFYHQNTPTREKPFGRDICEKCYTSKPGLFRHQATHYGERWFRKPSLECGLCEKTFSQKSDLSKHQRTHSGAPFECNACKRRYTTSSSLSRHQRAHSKGKPFVYVSV